MMTNSQQRRAARRRIAEQHAASMPFPGLYDAEALFKKHKADNRARQAAKVERNRQLRAALGGINPRSGLTRGLPGRGNVRKKLR